MLRLPDKPRTARSRDAARYLPTSTTEVFWTSLHRPTLDRGRIVMDTSIPPPLQPTATGIAVLAGFTPAGRATITAVCRHGLRRLPAAAA